MFNPNIQQFDGVAERFIIILDNCSIHHVPETIEKLLSFCPLTIEKLFSCIKYYLNRHDGLLQAVDDPIPIIQAAFDDIPPVSLINVKLGESTQATICKAFPCILAVFVHPDEEWSIQPKRRQIIFRAQVGNR